MPIPRICAGSTFASLMTASTPCTMRPNTADGPPSAEVGCLDRASSFRSSSNSPDRILVPPRSTPSQYPALIPGSRVKWLPNVRARVRPAAAIVRPGSRLLNEIRTVNESRSLLRNLHKSGDLLGILAARGDSTPLATSTPHGRTSAIASATFSGVSPPARMSGTPGSKPASNSHGAGARCRPSAPRRANRSAPPRAAAECRRSASTNRRTCIEPGCVLHAERGDVGERERVFGGRLVVVGLHAAKPELIRDRTHLPDRHPDEHADGRGERAAVRGRSPRPASA